MKINKNNIYKNFINIKNIINVKIMKCYKVLFNKRGIIKNIAFYIVSVIILLHIINIIIFYSNQRYLLNNKIKEIIFGIRNRILIDQNGLNNINTSKFKQIIKAKNMNIKKGMNNKNKILNKNIKKKKIKKSKLFPQINYNFYNKIVNKYYFSNKNLKKVNLPSYKFLKTNSLSKTKAYKNTSLLTTKGNINNDKILIL